ncbi:hypothetical protein CVT24_010615 [Panaeolus cyanescens]|uniref:SWR1-complex protein 4 n=1 Tax=Panaeolus cyanescens TaxID=181874 RepID=A0A409YLX6_9AGAR|nr:hypothetical protein CVT24_010615 [Panaeolus cyanescens]
MAASAADIRSALQLPDHSQEQGPSQPKKQPASGTRKPEGIPRELYALIGPQAPTLAAQLSKPRFKAKPKLGSVSAKSKWEWKTFKNGARNDGLMLGHWEKVAKDNGDEMSTEPDPSNEYKFAKYNIPPPAWNYTEDEYTRWLNDDNWSKEETDYLFKLVMEYDSRWYIVHDRYEYPGGSERSMEASCCVCRKLIRNRPWNGEESARAAMLSSFQFDKDRELLRKKYIQSLENRTPEQVAEEEALYIELKRLEQTERRFKRERENLLRTLAGMDSGLPDIVEDDGVSLGIIGAEPPKKKKKGTLLEAESPATPTPSSAYPAVKKQSTKDAAYDALHCIIRTDGPVTGSATKAAHQPAYLRSFKLPTPKPAILPKVTQALAELGITHTRLVMPTKDNVAHLEALVDATTALIETKRVSDKLDLDINVVKERIAMRRRSISRDAAEGAGGKDGMDVDGHDREGETEGEDGRAQSVASIRSGRNRKHVSSF